jgi:hypothetical protein
MASQPDALPETGDLRAEVKIDQLLADQGGQVDVHLGTRSVKVNLPPELMPGSLVQVNGLGDPNRHGGRGDLFLEVRLLPQNKEPEPPPPLPSSAADSAAPTDGRTMATPGEERRRRDPAGAFVFFILAAIVGIGGMFLIAAIRGPAKDADDRTRGGYMIFTLVMPAVFALIYQGKKHLARSAREALERDARRPILYLRAFNQDGKRLSAGFGVHSAKTSETLLVKALNKVAPVIAIGRPGEELPEPGAARLYVPHDAWQAVVGTLIHHARAVVLLGGNTPGLSWEMAALKRWAKPGRVFLRKPIVRPSHYSGTLSTREREEQEAEYEVFREAVITSMRIELPLSMELFDYVAFDEAWNPKPIKKWDGDPYNFYSQPAGIGLYSDRSGKDNLADYIQHCTSADYESADAPKLIMEVVTRYS